MSLRAFALLAFVVGCVGPTGPEGPVGEDEVGEPGDKGDLGPALAPSLMSVVPDLVYYGRQVDVLISGAGTSWSDPGTLVVDFGDGITVDPESIVVASPTALSATVTVATDTAVGLRTVRVVDGDEVAEFSGAFAVEPTLFVVPFNFFGPFTQNPALMGFGHTLRGTVKPAAIVLSDLSVPFHPFTDYVTILVGETPYKPLQNSESAAFFLLEVDVFAPLGDYGVIVESGPPDNVTISATAFPSVTIEDRLATELVPGHNEATLLSQDQSLLYQINLPDPGLWTFRISGDDVREAYASLLPESGKFAEALARGRLFPNKKTTSLFALTGAGDFYFAYGGAGFAPDSGYDFDIDVSWRSLSDAVPLAAPGVLGEIATPGEADWYVFQANAGEQAQLTVLQSPLGPPVPCGPFFGDIVDSELEVVTEDGSPVGLNNDLDGGSNWCSHLKVDVPSGLPSPVTYYARVSSDQNRFPEKEFPYALSFEVQ